ncbi:transposase family protein [Streptomyces sp. NPDC046557]|uniref:transposase family protein n=1 Tax=Streptomyces sp. NPDC046557 TaxID=3155372 RepID=UPI003409BF50
MVLVMQTDAPFWDSLVFPGIDDVDVEAVTDGFGTVEVVARGRADEASCPDCGRVSGRVHDRYQRRLNDLPLAEQGFTIRLTVRRFICGWVDCPRRTFRRAVLPAGHPARKVHDSAQPRLGASGARAGRAGRGSAGCPAGLRRGADDVVAQGHGAA